PGHLERDPCGEAVEAGLGLADVGEDEGAEARDRAPVAALLVAEAQEVVAGVVRRERLEPELRGELGHAELRRADPLTAELDGRAVRQLVVEHPTSDADTGLEHDDLSAGGSEIARRDQARDTRTDDDLIGIGLLTHAQSAYVVAATAPE